MRESARTAFQVLSVDASLLLAYALSFSREQEVNIFLLLREISDARPKATVFFERINLVICLPEPGEQALGLKTQLAHGLRQARGSLS